MKKIKGNISKRLDALENKIIREPIKIEGVLWFYETNIWVDMTHYDCVEDIPPELREKYQGAIAPGITTQGEPATPEEIENSRRTGENLLQSIKKYA